MKTAFLWKGLEGLKNSEENTRYIEFFFWEKNCELNSSVRFVQEFDFPADHYGWQADAVHTVCLRSGVLRLQRLHAGPPLAQPSLLRWGLGLFAPFYDRWE